MKLGVLTTTHIRNPAALGSLRLLVDSLRHQVPREDYGSFLVVDDCSPESPAGPYYRWLTESGVAEVYRLGPERVPFWGPKHGMEPRAGEGLSFGHAYGLMAGFQRLRELGCTHAWVIDSDCVVLRGGALREALALAETHQVEVVTDYFNGQPSPHVQIVGNVWHEQVGAGAIDKSRHPGHASWALYGFPVLFCAIVDLRTEARFGPLHNAGWVNSKWGYRLFRKNGRVAYYPFFQNGSIFHLGSGFTVANLGADRTFGNIAGPTRYGGKERGYHHAGYLQLDRPHAEHIAWLEAVAAVSPDRITEMPTSWLVPPDRETPTNADRFLRPLYKEDFAALCRIDADPETTRFLSWGPHGPERTRAFLDQALAARAEERWWALADRNDRLLGYGEIRPLPRVAPRACGIVYIVSPEHRRQGHGLFLLSELLGTATAQLDYDLCEVAIDTENVASLATLRKRSDFGDWMLDTTESYTLKGQARARHVYRRSVAITPWMPQETVEECLAWREWFLYEDRKMWRA